MKKQSSRATYSDLFPDTQVAVCTGVTSRPTWVFDDGGREKAGYKGNNARDCVCRAFAIAAEKPYQEIADLIDELAKKERITKRKKSRSSYRTGVFKQTIRRLAEELDMEWTPTMQIGSGCTVHLFADELPMGRLVCSVSRHDVAVIDRVVHDTHDPTREGNRCVYGYYKVKE
jgi:hypothetical protein